MAIFNTIRTGTGGGGGGDGLTIENVDDRVAALIVPGSNVTTNYDDAAGSLTISATFDTHTHTSSQITDFSEAVQDVVGALIVPGSNITATYDDASGALTISANVDAHTHTSSQITDFTEAVQDAVGSTIVAGTNITTNYNDVANTLTINASMPAHTHTSANITDFSEAVDDRVAALISVGTGSGITTSYDDTNNKLTISSNATTSANVSTLVMRDTGGSINVSSVRAYRSSLGVTSDDGIFLANETAATSGAPVQMSPRVHYKGTGWNTTSSASHTVDLISELLPTSGSSVGGSLMWKYSLNGGAYTQVLTLGMNGTLTTTGPVVLPGAPTADLHATTKKYVDDAIAGVSTGGAGGLTPEDVDDRVASLIVAGANITTSYDDALNTLTISSSTAAHTHTASQVTDFAEAVDDRISTTIVAGTNIVTNYDDNAGTLTINAPLPTHNHTASQISDFAEAVDDRVATLIVAGTNITKSYDDVNNTLTLNATTPAHTHTTSDITDFAEGVDDRVATLIVAGTNITKTYNDAANTLTIDAATPTAAQIGAAPASHTHTASQITDFAEAVDDRVGALVVSGTGITTNYDDTLNKLTVSANASTSTAGSTLVLRDSNGDFTTHAITLDVDPTSTMHAVTKQYADGLGSTGTGGNTIARRDGSGNLAAATFQGILVGNASNSGSNTGQSNVQLNALTNATSGVPVNMPPRIRFQGRTWDTTASSSKTVEMYEDFLPVSGATADLSGQFRLRFGVNGATPSTSFTVDGLSGTVTTTGPVVLPADPTATMHAATKQYVDAKSVVNAKQYGAKGDNATDDTTALQAAIDAMAAQPYGGTVMLPTGRYVVGQLRMKNRVTLAGEGAGTILRLKNATNMSMVVLNTNLVNNTMIRDLVIDGNKANQSSGAWAGIEYINSDVQEDVALADIYEMPGAKHVISNVAIVNTKGDGLLFDGVGGSQIINVRVAYAGLSGVNIAGNDSYFSNLDIGLSGRAGMKISGLGNHISNVKVWNSGMDAAFTDGDGIALSGDRNMLVNIMAQDNWRHGINLTGFNNMIYGYNANSNGSLYPQQGDGNATVVPTMGLRCAGFSNIVDMAIGRYGLAYQAYAVEIAEYADENFIRCGWNALATTNGANGHVLFTTSIVNNQISVGKMTWGAMERYITMSSTGWFMDAAYSYATVLVTASSAGSVTLPNYVAAGSRIRVIQRGAGQITFSPASGATLVNRSSHTKTAGLNAVVTLEVLTNSGSNAVWLLSGDTAA